MNQRDDDTDPTLDDAVLAELLNGIAPEAPPRALRARVLDRAHKAALPPYTLRAAEGPWKAVQPGIEVKPLAYDAATRMVSFLLRAQPGASLPAHGHHAFEECLVLEGEFVMGDLTLRAGDFHAATVGIEHPAATTPTGVLVYLRGAAEDYPFACP